ncbi:GNAT family N-acetyltransferase [Wenjunlia tyrosinilytica]|jgi:GNAT superfamily N-acetyltransferase|uniref:N-acetyltransferase n=1 Tax=Wenjunlia tyrosinilytica TaxID=1544741 RepID=A0A918DRF7_9ACTN|nr:GNAT family N-acetyltransferase [Wenjunlia tyrosinilytica]GGO80621.1 N-acetyltransferase [Wenjunlia tyrosinilytica]
MRTAVTSLADIFDLRHQVLRTGMPAEAAHYPEDARPDTFHLAAWDEQGRVVGCVTFFPDPWDGAPGATAYRFRGMGTAPEVRGQGYGAALIAAGIGAAAERGAEVVWCNGRTSARGFYERAGFTAVGEEFELAPSGPHYIFVHKA